jgi:prepilin-type N-terminal cleavage/methylation domain-containing protein
MKTPRATHGFSLVEILVAMTVSGLLMAGVMAFYIQSLKSMYASDQRIKLAGQINRFSNELIVQASRSNQFVLFKSPAAADFNGTNPAPDSGNSDRQTITSIDDEDPLHPAGDFVVFVYYEIPKPTAQAVHRISKLEGYFLNAGIPGSTGPVRKVVIDLSSAPSTDSIEKILTDNWGTTKAVFSTYFPLVRGLAVPEVIDGTAASGTPSPRLFYMSASRNVIITGQIFSSSQNTNTKDWRTYTNSFCFNITPRT